MNNMLDIKEIDDNYYIKLSAFIDVKNKYEWYEDECNRIVKDYYELYEKLRDAKKQAKKQIKDINKANQRNVSKLKKIKELCNNMVEPLDLIDGRHVKNIIDYE